jgi:F-type H+-transporting ATPase subunit gamma
MPNLETFKRKIDTAQDLQSVVKTMKALAAVSIRQYEKAVISLNSYDKTLEMGFTNYSQKCSSSLTKN